MILIRRNKRGWFATRRRDGKYLHKDGRWRSTTASGRGGVNLTGFFRSERAIREMAEKRDKEVVVNRIPL